MSYSLEYAKSDRSACNGPKSSCPSKDFGIAKGELRLGVEVLNIHGTKWRHWYCTTPKVLENMKSDFSEPSEINGWQDLRPEDQERVQRAWEEGEIPENERPEPAKEHATANKRRHSDTPATSETVTQENNDEDKEDVKKETPPKSAVKGTREKSGKQEVSIKEPATKKTKTIPEEPKVASYAYRSKKVNLREKKSKGEPTRRSSRITAIKKEPVKEELEEPVVASTRKRTSAKSTDDVTSKKSKKN
ncbi:hypothetical protein MFLAVUS_001000 [Mucor flavus]|uniref:PARP-type domain-containing protein n=1 Tax=Mucor flavus TaxID=439312 RepID=A0ABP9YL92_9FUNG